MKRCNKIIYWIATVWLALGMTATGIVQLLKSKEGAGGADSVVHLGYPMYILTLIGIWKLLGVIAILAPKLPLLKEWAYAGFFFLMSGAVYSHIVSGAAILSALPALLLLVLTIASWWLSPADRKLTLTMQPTAS